MANKGVDRRREKLQEKRDEAARLFARGESQAEVARQLGVTTATTCRWHQAWKRSGKKGLKLSERLGRPCKLGARDYERIEKALLKGPQAYGYSTDLWTLPRIAEVIESLTGVRYNPGHVWKIMRKLGWSLQRPAKQARERDEDAILQWQKETWPALKKTSGAGAR